MAKRYICTACEWIYDPAVGEFVGRIAPVTAFEDITEDSVSPALGVSKADLEECSD